MKIIPTTKIQRYLESPQANPISWQLLKNVGENTFQCVTSHFKCKDFFNDFCVFLHTGHEFTVYQMPIKQDMFNLDWVGIPILLHNTLPGFEQNVKELLNPYLCAQDMPPLTQLEQVEENKWFINIPAEYFKNTFYISTLTLLIRIMNQPVIVGTWDDLLEYLKKKLHSADCALYAHVVRKPMKNMPDELKQYVIGYNNSVMGSSKGNYTVEDLSKQPDDWWANQVFSLHNCGIQNWDYMSQLTGTHTVWPEKSKESACDAAAAMCV